MFYWWRVQQWERAVASDLQLTDKVMEANAPTYAAGTVLLLAVAGFIASFFIPKVGAQAPDTRRGQSRGRKNRTTSPSTTSPRLICASPRWWPPTRLRVPTNCCN